MPVGLAVHWQDLTFDDRGAGFLPRCLLLPSPILIHEMATRAGRRRADPDDDEESRAPRAAAPAAAEKAPKDAPAAAARAKTPTPTPGAADADPENITAEFLADFNSKKGEIERIVESVKKSTALILNYSQQTQQACDPGEVESELRPLHFLRVRIGKRCTFLLAEYSKQLSAEVKSAAGNAARGKKLLDKLKAEEDALRRAHPKSARLQPYKAQYMRLCKVYVDAMKEHQQAKVRSAGGGGVSALLNPSRPASRCCICRRRRGPSKWRR